MTETSTTVKGGQLPGIAEILWKMILNEGLKRGDKLPAERVLAAKFRVTRGSVRLGIQSLTERGILLRRQGDGTYIASISEEVFVKKSMVMAMQVQSNLMKDILEFRRILEPQIAALAAGRISDEELDALKILVCNQQLKNGLCSGDLDTAFHLQLSRYSGNSVLFKVMDLLNDILSESRADRFQSEQRKTMSVTGHLLIIEALAMRDKEKAFKAMRDHLDQVESGLPNDLS
ncbi:MAG: FadR/GntR family transcriptional regulator [Desulfocapsaceae bacterium]|nr:FadR/GntR family transcriptional regulator [Desulfocapsaceae bacterium]